MRHLRPLLVYSAPLAAGVLAFLVLWPCYFLLYYLNPYNQYQPWTYKWEDPFKALVVLSFGVHVTLSLGACLLLARHLHNPLALAALAMAVVLLPFAFYTLKFLDYWNACEGIAFPLPGGTQQFDDGFNCYAD